MQTIYATHLPLPGPADSSARKAQSLVDTWVTRRFHVSVEGESGRTVAPSSTVEWSTLRSDASRLFSLWVELPDSGNPAWTWRTLLDIGTESGKAWVRVRVQLNSSIEGMLVRPEVESGRPAIVRDLIRDLSLFVDGQPLGHYRGVAGGPDGRSFAGFLLDQTRRLPVVVIAQGSDATYPTDPKRLTDRLLGLAHVATVDVAASFGLTNELGKTLSVFGGAIRIYWPGLTTRSDPYRHRLYLPSVIERLEADGLVQELFESLGQLAGFSVDEPALRRRLINERRRREAEAGAAERADLAARLASERASSKVDLSTDYEELFEAWSKAADRIQELEEEANDRDEEVIALEAERDNAIEQQKDLLTAWREEQAGRRAVSPDQFAPLTSYGSVLEAVEAAEKTLPGLVFLDEARTSAKASGYAYPQRVFESLALASEVAVLWKEGVLNAGPTQEFRQRAGFFRDGIGDGAAGQFRGDYERNYNGDTILLAPHFRHGIGAVANILRIYMYFDTSSELIVIGHVGRKLRDTTNRN